MQKMTSVTIIPMQRANIFYNTGNWKLSHNLTSSQFPRSTAFDKITRQITMSAEKIIYRDIIQGSKSNILVSIHLEKSQRDILPQSKWLFSFHLLLIIVDSFIKALCMLLSKSDILLQSCFPLSLIIINSFIKTFCMLRSQRDIFILGGICMKNENPAATQVINWKNTLILFCFDLSLTMRYFLQLSARWNKKSKEKKTDLRLILFLCFLKRIFIPARN